MESKDSDSLDDQLLKRGLPAVSRFGKLHEIDDNVVSEAVSEALREIDSIMQQARRQVAQHNSFSEPEGEQANFTNSSFYPDVETSPNSTGYEDVEEDSFVGRVEMDEAMHAVRTQAVMEAKREISQGEDDVMNEEVKDIVFRDFEESGFTQENSMSLLEQELEQVRRELEEARSQLAFPPNFQSFYKKHSSTFPLELANPMCLTICCRHLLQMDWLTSFNPLVALYRLVDDNYYYVDQTEWQRDELNPNFKTNIVIKYDPKEAQQTYMLRLFDLNDLSLPPESGEGDPFVNRDRAIVSDKDLVGEAFLCLHELVNSRFPGEEQSLEILHRTEPLLTHQMMRAGSRFVISYYMEMSKFDDSDERELSALQSPSEGGSRGSSSSVKSKKEKDKEMLNAGAVHLEFVVAIRDLPYIPELDGATPGVSVFSRTFKMSHWIPRGQTETGPGEADVDFEEKFRMVYNKGEGNELKLVVHDLSPPTSRHKSIGTVRLHISDLLRLKTGTPLSLTLKHPTHDLRCAQLLITLIRRGVEVEDLPTFSPIITTKKFMEPRSPVMVPEVMEKFEDMMVDGRSFVRYFMDQPPERITVFYQKSNRRLFWCAEGHRNDDNTHPTDITRSMSLEHVRGIVIGKQCWTLNQAVAKREAVDQCTFSIFSGDNVLHLQSKDEGQRDTWVMGIYTLAHSYYGVPPTIYQANQWTVGPHPMREKPEVKDTSLVDNLQAISRQATSPLITNKIRASPNNRSAPNTPAKDTTKPKSPTKSPKPKRKGKKKPPPPADIPPSTPNKLNDPLSSPSKKSPSKSQRSPGASSPQLQLSPPRTPRSPRTPRTPSSTPRTPGSPSRKVLWVDISVRGCNLISLNDNPQFMVTAWSKTAETKNSNHPRSNLLGSVITKDKGKSPAFASKKFHVPFYKGKLKKKLVLRFQVQDIQGVKLSDPKATPAIIGTAIVRASQIKPKHGEDGTLTKILDLRHPDKQRDQALADMNSSIVLTVAVSDTQSSMGRSSASPGTGMNRGVQSPLRSPLTEQGMFKLKKRLAVGQEFVSFSNDEKPKTIFLFFTKSPPPSAGTLYWCEPGRKTMLPSQSMDLTQLKQVFQGTAQSPFQVGMSLGCLRLNSDLCFSLITGPIAGADSQRLDLQAPDRKTYKAWIRGLEQLVAKVGGKVSVKKKQG